MLDKTFLMYLSCEIGSSKHDNIIPASGVCGSCRSITLLYVIVVFLAIIVCGGIDSIPANIGERIIHPHEATYAFSLLTIYACRLKIFIWIRGFLGEGQCCRRDFVNFSYIVAHFHSLVVYKRSSSGEANNERHLML